jgi:hypothetical protein
VKERKEKDRNAYGLSFMTGKIVPTIPKTTMISVTTKIGETITEKEEKLKKNIFEMYNFLTNGDQKAQVIFIQ